MFSGIYSLNADVLIVLPVSVMCTYFVSWTSSLLGDPKYAVAVGDSTCGSNCTSYFLPSGIETARKVSDYLNLTLLEGGLFQGGDTIEISNAPGLLLDFMALDSTFMFDLENECQVYGTQMNDSLQLCIRQVDSSIAVGESHSRHRRRPQSGPNASSRMESMPNVSLPASKLPEEHNLARRPFGYEDSTYDIFARRNNRLPAGRIRHP